MNLLSTPKGPSTNKMRTLGFCIGDCDYGLGQVLILEVLGPSKNPASARDTAGGAGSVYCVSWQTATLSSSFLAVASSLVVAAGIPDSEVWQEMEQETRTVRAV